MKNAIIAGLQQAKDVTKVPMVGYVRITRDGRYSQLEIWRDNGTKHIRADYCDNQPHGRFTAWNTAGDVVKDCVYVHGKETTVRQAMEYARRAFANNHFAV